MRLPFSVQDAILLNAVQAGLCGVKAVEDMIREICDVSVKPKLTLKQLNVSGDNGRYSVSLAFEEGFTYSFSLPRCQRKLMTWAEAEAFIKQRQTELPPHLRGPEHNGSEEDVREVIGIVTKATGYEVALEDFAVRKEYDNASKSSGRLMFGGITRVGSMAMNRYRELLGGTD